MNNDLPKLFKSSPIKKQKKEAKFKNTYYYGNVLNHVTYYY